jgi:diguanylate cyclase (GGDEF)-like protein
MDGMLQQRRGTVVALLFFCGLGIVLALWMLETRLGLITALDQAAYPALALMCAAMPPLLRWLPHRRTRLEMAAYGAIAIYFLAKLSDTMLGPQQQALYTAASLLQWLPFLYVAAFVFFERRTALLAGGTVFAMLAVLPLAALAWAGRPDDGAVPMLLVNACAVHFLILASLSMISTLNARYEDARLQARKLESAATTDLLTGLANRRGLEQLLLGVAARPGRSIGLVLLDVDHFKLVNDRFGHLVGDDLLVHLAQRMRQALPDHARVGRWGGEEFLIVVLDDCSSTLDVAERMRQAVAAKVHPVAGCVTISAGAALWQTGQPVAAALRRADAALYEAKSRGRNRVVPADAALLAEHAGAAA